MAITWLADVLRGAGLTVVEHAGWKTRAIDGDWSPRYGIVHATAAPRSQSDTDQIRIVRDGRTGLRGPIANACVDRAGRWHVLAAGRCNTTIEGTAGPYQGLGNTYALGVEACNDNVDEPWLAVQYDSYVRGWAAIARKLGWTPERLRGHKEHTPGHKTDPTFNMTAFRGRVAAVLAGEDNDVGTLTGVQGEKFDDMHYTLTGGINNPAGTGSVPFHVWAEWLTSTVKALAAAQAQGDAALAAQLGQIDSKADARAVAEAQRDAELRALLEQAQSGEVSAEEVVQRLAERLAA
jgi:hypothetical protein